MRYHEISYTHLTKQSLFNTATLFVPQDRVEEFIATLALFGARIARTRVSPRSQGYSVDALVDNPKAASDLLLMWCLQKQHGQ
jgi:hypothetical protein